MRNRAAPPVVERPGQRCPSWLLRDARGLVYTEYLVVTVGVALPLCLALLKVGDLLLRLYHFQQRLIRFPIP